MAAERMRLLTGVGGGGIGASGWSEEAGANLAQCWEYLNCRRNPEPPTRPVPTSVDEVGSPAHAVVRRGRP